MTFNDLNLNNSLLAAINDMGIEKPTTIQHKAFNPIMSGVDMCGIAQTGTGKTFAYLLPILRIWKFDKSKKVTTLILVPTRELVVQVVEAINQLSTYLNVTAVGVYGGANIKEQSRVVNEGLDILVGTPGRVYDIINHGVIKTKTIKTLVIDEVDEMLDQGMRSQIKRILDELPEKRQNLMFSATINQEVEAIITQYFKDPVYIEAAPAGSPLESIKQSAYEVPNFNTKINILKHILTTDESTTKVIVFTGGKKLADAVAKQLENDFNLGANYGVIHSNKEQNHRFNTVNQFNNSNYKFIIATDIIARGLDVAEVSHVINFDLPNDANNYIHRIGRTGRADKNGIAIAFITPNDNYNKNAIEQLMKFEIPITPLPNEVLVSNILEEFEIEKVIPKEIKLKLPKLERSNPGFHEKSAKNSKVNAKRISKKDAMMLKYGKPLKRKPKQ